MKFDLFSQYKGLRREIYVLFFGRIVTGMGSMIWPILTMIMNQKLNMTATAISMFSLICGAVQMMANFFGGKLADKFNKRNIIVVCDSVSIILFILCGLLPLRFFTIIILFVASLFQTIEYPAYDALVADLTFTKDRESAYSLLYLGMNLGLVASPTIAGLLFNNYLWLSFIISGVSIGTSTLIISANIKDVTPIVETSSQAVYQKSEDDSSIWKILKDNKVIVLFIFATALYYATYNEYGILMPLDMGNIHGDKGALIYGTVTSLNCIIVVFCTPLITKLFIKVPHTFKFTIGCLLLLLGFVVLLIGMGNIPIYYIAITLFTLGEIFNTTSSSAYRTSRVPASHRGRLNGIFTMILSPFYGAMIFVCGIVYDRNGSFASWSIVIGTLLISIVLFIILIIKDKKRYPELYRKDV